MDHPGEKNYALPGTDGVVAELDFLLAFHHMPLNHKEAAAGADHHYSSQEANTAVDVGVVHHKPAVVGMKVR